MKPLISLATLAVATLIAYTDPQSAVAKNTGSQQVASAAILLAKPNLDVVVAHYLYLKNALATDNSKGAATAGGELHKALVALGKEGMTASQTRAYNDIASNAEENAEHISENTGNIKRQREHFQSLSEDMYDLVNAFGTPQILYKDYCPMAKAIWLSEVKDIKNPYYGKAMSTCGQAKETIKP